MAKKNDATQLNTGEKKEGFGSKLLTFIVILIIIAVWLAILGLLIKFDIGGLGERFRPALENVPVLQKVLPELSDEELAYKNQYPYKNLDEAMKRIKELEEYADKADEEIEDFAARQKALQEENDSLRHFEEEYDTFLESKKEFDNSVVFNEKAPEASDYIKWYEQMYPESAATIYEELKAKDVADESIATVAQWFAKMKAKDAAAVLEQYTSDVDFICDILDCLKPTFVSEIMTAMKKDDVLFAAKVSEYRAKRESYELED